MKYENVTVISGVSTMNATQETYASSNNPLLFLTGSFPKKCLVKPRGKLLNLFSLVKNLKFVFRK